MVGVSINNVTKVFDKFTAVDDLNLDILPGEFFTFLGPSGCGKTTTLRMVAGFIYPSSGNILFDDKDITYLPPNKRDIGMVFQNYALFPHLTVGENVAFGLKLRKFSKAEIDKRVEEALETVHLSGVSKRKINAISGGQQQRVALARAIVIKPQILLLDEPLSNLDAKLREDTRTEIKRIQMLLGITTIYVTHDQGEALAVSDRIMIMKNGIVQQTGGPTEIYTRPSNVFVAEFIGKSNIIQGEILEINDEKVTFQTKDGAILTGLKENASPNFKFAIGEKIKIAIRPECFEIENSTEKKVITGLIEHMEFTGAIINCLVKTENESLKISFPGENRVDLVKGNRIFLSIPQNMVYFIENIDSSIKSEGDMDE